MSLTIPDVLPLIKSYYAKPGNGCGGSLHIVLEDGNVRDGDVAFCLREATDKGDEDGRDIAEKLLKMSKTQRSKLALAFKD